MRRALKSLYSTYPNALLSDAAIEEWLCIFEKYDLEVFEQAFRAAKFVSSEFLPTPGLVMKEMRELGKDASNKQTKEWTDSPNGHVSMKITTESTDEKGKAQTIIRHYVDTSSADKWQYRKKMFESGLWLTIESIGEKQAVYSYQKWPHKMPSSQFVEGGYHEREGEKLPFLLRA